MTITVPPQSAALIARYGMEGADYAPEIPAPVFMKAWTGREIHWNDQPSQSAVDFAQVGDWNNGYRAVWVNRAERAIFSYCEGDLGLTVDDDEETFMARLAAAAAFYERVS